MLRRAFQLLKWGRLYLTSNIKLTSPPFPSHVNTEKERQNEGAERGSRKRRGGELRFNERPIQLVREGCKKSVQSLVL